MADRKAELERKKAKLEELRKEKQRRQQERERQEVLINTFCIQFYWHCLTCNNYFKVENSHRVLREGDQNVTMDDLLKREGLKPVSGKLLKISQQYNIIILNIYAIPRCAINICTINTRTK